MTAALRLDELDEPWARQLQLTEKVHHSAGPTSVTTAC
jgi:hypothetical protein